MARWSFWIICFLSLAGGLVAQTTVRPGRVRLEGDWQAKTDDGIRHISVRADSSAQFGDQVARWRVVGDSLWLTLGDGVWMVYGLRGQTGQTDDLGGRPQETGDAASRGTGQRAARHPDHS